MPTNRPDLPPLPEPEPYESVADRHERLARDRERSAARKEARLNARVLSEGFPIAPKERREVVERCLTVMRSGSPRDAVGAAKALIAANQQNVMLASQELPQSQVNVQVNVGNVHSLSDAELERLIREGGDATDPDA